jgi:ribosomal protein L37AE/L43A
MYKHEGCGGELAHKNTKKGVLVCKKCGSEVSTGRLTSGGEANWEDTKAQIRQNRSEGGGHRES